MPCKQTTHLIRLPLGFSAFVI